MDQYCDVCDSVLVWRTRAGMLDHQECPACKTATLQLPPNSLTTKRRSAVIEHYYQMPLPGVNDGDTYYVTSMEAICRWDAKMEDYQILPISAFKWPKPEDEFNNRRGAILAQRGRKSRPHD